MGSEIEFKFDVLPGGVDAVRAKLQSFNPEQVELRAHYFDTADRALASKGVVLRIRQEGRQWFQTVKARGAGTLARIEHNIDLGQLEKAPRPDLALFEGTDIGDLLGGVLKNDAPLQPVFSTEIIRTRAVVAHRGSRVELALDIGDVTAPTPTGVDLSSPVCELEMELVQGSVADLTHLATQWLAQTYLSLSTLSKAARGERLLVGWPMAVAVKAPAVEYPKRRSRMAGDAVQQLVVSSCLSHILPNATEAAGGNNDHDVVHQLRVGIRRLRTALRELEDLSPGRFKPEWEAPLKRTFNALGKRRDRELLEAEMQPGLEEQGGPKVDLGEKTLDGPLDAAVRDTEFQIVLVELLGLCSADEGTGLAHQGNGAERGKRESHDRSASERKTLRVLGKRLDALRKKVVKGGKAFQSLTVDEQHRVRKQLKRLRYLTEFVGPLFDAKWAARYIKHLTPAQDALGEFNDRHVALASYQARVAYDPRAWFAVGWLSATRAADAQTCSESIRAIAKVKRFWRH